MIPMSIDTQALVNRLKKMAVGEVIPYQELSALIGRDVRNGARSYLQSAIRHLLDQGMAFGVVRGEGVKLLTDDEIVDVGAAGLKKIRRASFRSTKVLTAVRRFDALDRDRQIEHNLALSLHGIVQFATKPLIIKQLRARVDESQAQLPVQKMLDALKSS